MYKKLSTIWECNTLSEKCEEMKERNKMVEKEFEEILYKQNKVVETDKLIRDNVITKR